ncbi:hypothetical protein OIO90_006423 [Microbotryomycetes sp. JL221]|nr:hypothetical protein OIO90_006423 [Microbotryomycetes sp. JL221]
MSPVPTNPQESGKKGWAIDFEGQTVVVSGGNRGLGLGVSEALAQAGASVAILFNSAKDAHEVADKLAKKWDAKIKAYQCNVSGDFGHIKDTFAQIEKDLGQIKGLVANAGISVVKPALELTREDFDKVMGVNVFGVFQTCQAAAALWTERQEPGSIVVISSMSSQIVNWPITQVFYNTSKGAVSNMVRCLAMEWAEKNIRVNTVSPGFINTDQTSHMDPKLLKSQAETVPIKRFSEPFEQTGQVLLLLSNKYSSYITGAEHFVDGGFLCL